MKQQYVILVYDLRADGAEVIGPFSTEASAIEFARRNVAEERRRYIIRPISSPEFV